MSRSSAGRRLRSKALRLAAIALLLLVAAGCEDTLETEYNITADADRGSGGALQALTVNGKGFTENGTVLITVVLTATGGDANPYIEEEIQAGADGKFKYEKRPLPCPQPANYKTGSWSLVVARDMSSGISGSDRLDPGSEPDCTGS